jgi:hypothetical protein
MKHTGEGLERLLRSYFDSDDEHPDLDGVLFRYADATLDPQERAEVDAHIEHCARCREDLADAVAAQRSVERRRRPPALLIAAALAAVVVAAALLWPHREPVMTRSAASVPASVPIEWRVLVQQARAQRRIDAPPAVRALQIERDILRDHPATPASGTFAPSGTVIETRQPDFHWPAKNNAAYRVRIFEKEKEVAQSPLLHENRWTPPQPLDRGTTYVWQVEIRGNGRGSGSATILPAPPDPPALFTVLDAKTAAMIEDARRRFPDDRPLLAVLYARAGVRDRAEDEIGRWLVLHPEDAAARDLLTSIQKW